MPTVVTAGPLVAGGASLIRSPGEKVILATGAIPGEEVEVVVDKEESQLIHAHVSRVVTASDHRVEPECELFDAGCGGCPWDFIEPSAQHEFKTGIVRDSISHIAKRVDADIAFYDAVRPRGYRTILRMGLNDGKPGMRQVRTNNVLPPIPCTIVHPLLHHLIADAQYDARLNEINLRGSLATGDTVAYAPGHSSPPLNESISEQPFRISSGSFFQSGPEAAQLLASLVAELVPKNASIILDAYAGIGILGAIAAERTGATLISVEQNRSAVADAKHNLAHLEAHVVESEVAEIELAGTTRPDVVIADPSRTGLGKSTTKALARLGSPVLILVSCDPSSLARDVTLLETHGYELGPIRVLDLFPQTPHVETVTTFHLR